MTNDEKADTLRPSAPEQDPLVRIAVALEEINQVLKYCTTNTGYGLQINVKVAKEF